MGSFNSAVAKLREFSNFLFANEKIERHLENYLWSIFLRLIYVFTPHFSEELSKNNNKSICNLSWPKFDEKYIREDLIKFIIQINGKKKAIVDVEKNLNEDQIVKLLKEDNNVNKIFSSKVKKTIFIKNKIINFVL